ncbi:TPA: PspC domain-containing protein [Candidatus Berkelbacteria bacterium]|uniref:Putative stress-responsive transcriptional regulator n=1 Tax=Berkelbacteria bacterium GW2011_GWE1_39_12 TaxID=1618337 RepID=A0A0G4B534_9BACT|nr:MAG: putative stress-responsive transcriptional regulator [Berkelbacteria bacterium GW2011_GWE1_39_12]HBO60392.1 PspC domain-containing protein [Candidatus Berkelbacteria bacterium]
MTKELVRPKKGRVLFGVAQGLGEYFEIDPVIVRIIFIILTIWGGIGVILYILGIFLIPDENGDEIEKEAKDLKKDKEKIKDKFQANTRSVAEEVKYKSNNYANQYDHEKKSGSIIFGLIVLVFGLMLLFNNIFPWFSWGRFWPLILITIGLIIISSGRKKAE